MRRALCLLAITALAWAGSPVGTAVAENATVSDTLGDGATHGDISSLQINHDEETLVLGLVVADAEAPTTSNNWTNDNSQTHIEWELDTTGDGNSEYYVIYLADTQAVYAAVYRSGDSSHACDAVPAFANGTYTALIDRNCIGNPANLRATGLLVYDATPGVNDQASVDIVPNTEFSQNVPAPPNPNAPPLRFGVVGRTTDALYAGHGYGSHYDGLGGRLVAAPAVARIGASNPSNPPNVLYVGTGTDNQLWARTDTLGWRRLSSTGTFCKGGPGAFIAGSSALTVACRGGDDALYYAEATIGDGSIPVMNTWKRLGGILSAGPAIGISQQKGDAITFLVVGQDGRIYENTKAGYAAMPWQCKGHVAFNSLGDTSWFGCRGLNDALWVARNTPSGWGGVFSLGGVLTAGPGVAVGANASVFLVQGGDNGVWQRIVNNESGNPTGGYASNGGQIKFGVNAAAL